MNVTNLSSHLVLVFFLHLLHLSLLAALVALIRAPTLVLALIVGLLLNFSLLASALPLSLLAALSLVLLRDDLLRLRLPSRGRAERDRHL